MKNIIYCPLVFGKGDNTVSVLCKIVCECKPSKSWKIIFLGDCFPAPDTKSHFESVILNLVSDYITEPLQPCCFEISFQNLGATAIVDSYYTVSGHSADLALYLLLLGSVSSLHLPDNLVATGHIANRQGDVLPVSQLPKKISATLRQLPESLLVHPKESFDDSAKVLRAPLSEEEYITLRTLPSSIKSIAVTTVAEALQQLFPLSERVLACLRTQRRGHYDSLLYPDPEEYFYEALRERILFYRPFKDLSEAWKQYYGNNIPLSHKEKIKALYQSLPPLQKYFVEDHSLFKECHIMKEASALIHQQKIVEDEFISAFLEKINLGQLTQDSTSKFEPVRCQKYIPSFDKKSFFTILNEWHIDFFKRITDVALSKSHSKIALIKMLERIPHLTLSELNEAFLVSPARVFEKVTEQLIDEEIKTEIESQIAYRIETQLSELNFDEQLELSSKFLRYLGSSLPSNLRNEDSREYVAHLSKLVRLALKTTLSIS